MVEHEAWLHEFFEQQIPFNKHLGMTIDLVDEGRCRLRIPYGDELIGDSRRPALHGGVISTLADTAGGLAAFSTIDPSRSAVSTVDLRVDYLRRGRMEDLLCDAHVVRAGNRVIVTAMTVHHGDPASYVCAEARAVYNIHHRER